MQGDKTRTKIAQACMELLETTPLEALRTQDILKKAGVSRSTFYRCFPDKYEVANWVYQDQTEKIIRQYPNLKDWTEWTVVLHDFMRAHRRFYRNIASYEGQNSFRDFLCRYFMNNVLRTRSRRDREITEDQKYGIYAFSLVGAQATIDWIKNGFEPNTETFMHRLKLCIPEHIREFYE